VNVCMYVCMYVSVSRLLKYFLHYYIQKLRAYMYVCICVYVCDCTYVVKMSQDILYLLCFKYMQGRKFN